MRRTLTTLLAFIVVVGAAYYSSQDFVEALRMTFGLLGMIFTAVLFAFAVGHDLKK